MDDSMDDYGCWFPKSRILMYFRSWPTPIWLVHLDVNDEVWKGLSPKKNMERDMDYVKSQQHLQEEFSGM